MFHTYVDYTFDEKPFYVGMGNKARVQRMLCRNKHHTHVAKKHGQIRRIIASFDNRESAVELEIKLIAKHHTFIDDPSYNGIGTNYTAGGEGRPCSDEMKQKMRDIIKAQYASGREPWNKGKQGLTFNVSDEVREKAVNNSSHSTRVDRCLARITLKMPKPECVNLTSVQSAECQGILRQRVPNVRQIQSTTLQLHNDYDIKSCRNSPENT